MGVAAGRHTVGDIAAALRRLPRPKQRATGALAPPTTVVLIAGGRHRADALSRVAVSAISSLDYLRSQSRPGAGD